MKKNDIELVIYCDVPPLEFKGSGLSVLLFNLLKGVVNHKLLILSYWYSICVQPGEIYSATNHDIFLFGKYLKYFEFINYRRIRRILDSVAYIIDLIPISKILLNNKNSKVLFLIGSSATPLWKVWICQKIFPNKILLYIVDDYVGISKLEGKYYERLLVKLFHDRVVKNSEIVYLISQGFQDEYQKYSNVKTKLLLPTFNVVNSKTKCKTDNNEYSFCYTGGLNFLYNKSLIAFAEVLNEINISSTVKYKLIVQTYSSYDKFISLGLNYANVVYSSFDDRKLIYNVYDQCDCFVIPYTFEKKYRNLVKTSFPQKTAELIQLNKKILVIGPNDSSIVDFFKKNNLEFVCTTVEKNILKMCIENISKCHNNESIFERYSMTYNKHFKPANNQYILFGD